MRHIREPLTLPKHPKLLHNINEMSMRIKIWKLHREEVTGDQFEKLIVRLTEPSWDEVEQMLMDAYRAINEQREDPRKY